MMGLKLSKAQRDAMRPLNCPNFGTMRICGKAYQSGCRQTPCMEGYEEYRKVKAVKRKAYSKPKATPEVKKAPPVVLATKFPKSDTTHSPDWNWHGDCCGRQVWRPKNFGCSPVLSNSPNTAGLLEDEHGGPLYEG